MTNTENAPKPGSIDLDWFSFLVQTAQARTGQAWQLVANQVFDTVIASGEDRDQAEGVFIAWMNNR